MVAATYHDNSDVRTYEATATKVVEELVTVTLPPPELLELAAPHIVSLHHLAAADGATALLRLYDLRTHVQNIVRVPGAGPYLGLFSCAAGVFVLTRTHCLHWRSHAELKAAPTVLALPVPLPFVPGPASVRHLPRVLLLHMAEYALLDLAAGTYVLPPARTDFPVQAGDFTEQHLALLCGEQLLVTDLATLATRAIAVPSSVPTALRLLDDGLAALGTLSGAVALVDLAAQSHLYTVANEDGSAVLSLLRAGAHEQLCVFQSHVASLWHLTPSGAECIQRVPFPDQKLLEAQWLSGMAVFLTASPSLEEQLWQWIPERDRERKKKRRSLGTRMQGRRHSAVPSPPRPPSAPSLAAPALAPAGSATPSPAASPALSPALSPARTPHLTRTDVARGCEALADAIVARLAARDEVAALQRVIAEQRAEIAALRAALAARPD